MRPRGPAWAGWALAALLAWLVAYPLLLVALDAVRDGAGWTVAPLQAFATRPTEWAALWGSLWLSLATVALAALVGVPLAWGMARTDFPGRRLVHWGLTLPAILPPLVGVLAFLFLAGESGFLARLVRAVTGSSEPPWRLRGPAAILLVHVYATYVYFYLFVRAALTTLDPALLEAAAGLGASPWRTATRVVLPLLRPALTSAALLAFMTSLGSFSAPYLFGGGMRVMTTQIVSTRLNGEYPLAMVETLALAAIAVGALWLIGRLDVEEPATVAAKSPARLRPAPAAGLRGALTVAGLRATALLMVLPHLTLLVVSFVPAGTWTTEAIPPAWTAGNYRTLVTDPVRLAPILNSLWMGTLVTLAVVSLAVAAGTLVVRARVPARRAIEALLALPWAVPGTVFAIALATMFSADRPLALRWILVGTPWLLPLAYLVRVLPIAGRATLAGFRRLDPVLEEAAAGLGAGRVFRLRRVTLPLLAPALLAGAALAFVAAFGDFVTSIVLYTYDTRPVSLEILGSLRQADVGVAAAYGVLLMAIGGAVFALAGERGGGA